MAASRIIEQESGTFTGRLHPHNGYYAGDFSDRRLDAPAGLQVTLIQELAGCGLGQTSCVSTPRGS